MGENVSLYPDEAVMGETPPHVVSRPRRQDVDIGDIVPLNNKGWGLRPNGKQMSRHEVAMVREHQDLIRGAMGQLATDSTADEAEGVREHKPAHRLEDSHAARPAEVSEGLWQRFWTSLDDEDQRTMVPLLPAHVEPAQGVEPAGYMGRTRHAEPEIDLGPVQGPEREPKSGVAPEPEPDLLPRDDAASGASESKRKRGLARMAGLGAAGAWVASKLHRDRTERTEQVESSESERTSRSKWVVAGLGALAVAGIATVAYLVVRHGLHHDIVGGGIGHPEPSPTPAPSPIPPVSPPPPVLPPPPVVPPPGGEMLHPQTLALDYYGDTIWGGVVSYADRYGVALSEAQTYQIVGDVLDTNGLTWEQARHLPVGYQVALTPEQIIQIQTANW